MLTTRSHFVDSLCLKTSWQGLPRQTTKFQLSVMSWWPKLMAFLLQCSGTSFASVGKVSDVIIASLFASPGGTWPGDTTACRVPPPLSSKVAKLIVPLAAIDYCFSPTSLFLSVGSPASPQARLFIPPLWSWTLGQNAASSPEASDVPNFWSLIKFCQADHPVHPDPVSINTGLLNATVTAELPCFVVASIAGIFL